MVYCLFIEDLRSNGYHIDYHWKYSYYTDYVTHWINKYKVPVMYSFKFRSIEDHSDKGGHSVMAHGYKYKKRLVSVLWWEKWEVFEKVIHSNFGWGEQYRNFIISVKKGSMPSNVEIMRNYSTEVIILRNE